MVSYNAFKRHTLKWWKKSFFYMFMLAVLNSFILYKSTAAKKMSHFIFRKELSNQLMQKVPIPLIPAAKLPDVGESVLFCLTARHFPKAIKPKTTSKRPNSQQDCAVCSEPGKRKHTRNECPCCNVGLHIETCFEIFHNRKDYKRSLKRQLPQE
ncbi:PiggyBac transposable element-derived protein 4 [Plakobranchus ocellatus]|uniref:PiggyBac transposable element-derived protein 4 n=1 Tax=Plakobranchus ocellatus TaxID=259542 RepID=A0AAV3YZL6_9GAST|nr:PiggyBac transposable element-derived protein 4 [Plakobranchus ocellatus]